MLYNEDWREGNEISKEEFLKELELESIYISKKDIAYLLYVAGDLFTDHAISLSVNEQMQITYTSLEG